MSPLGTYVGEAQEVELGSDHYSSQRDAAAEGLQREGFWGSFGLGYGSLGLDGMASREDGLSGNLAIGGSVSERFLLGAGTTGWTKDLQGGRITFGTLTALARFYPSADGGFFLTAGLGFGSVTLEVDGFGSDSDSGGGAVLGVGYDLRLGSSNWAFTPYANSIGHAFDEGNANVLQFGLGLTYH